MPNQLFCTLSTAVLASAALSMTASRVHAQPASPEGDLRNHPAVAVRVESATKLGARVASRDPLAITALAQAAKNDPAEAVRVAAIRALGRAPDCQLVRAVLEQSVSADPSQLARTEAGAVLRALRCAAPAAPKRNGGGAEDVARNRMIFGHSAHTSPAGTASWEMLDIAAWTFSYALRDDLELSVLTGPPIGAFAIMPSLRYSMGTDTARVSLTVQAGTFIPYADSNPTTFWLAGGGVTATFGAGGHYFNMALYGFAGGEHRNNSYYSNRNNVEAALLFQVGGSLRLSERFRFAIEAWLPILPGRTNPVEAAVVLYGLKVVSKRIYGTVGFAAPIAKGVGELYKYLPIGVPMLAFGFTW
jgi:hypothetical protein